MQRLLGNGAPMEQEGPDPSLLQRKIERLEGDLEDAREELAETKEQLAAVSRGQAKLKQALQPVYDGLRMIFGELKNVAADNVSPSQSSGPLDSSRYEPWRQKFRGQTANAIDVLVKYEAGLTRRQLAGFLRVEPGSGTMSQIIFKLNKAELIEKDGSNIRLKKL